MQLFTNLSADQLMTTPDKGVIIRANMTDTGTEFVVILDGVVIDTIPADVVINQFKPGDPAVQAKADEHAANAYSKPATGDNHEQ